MATTVDAQVNTTIYDEAHTSVRSIQDRRSSSLSRAALGRGEEAKTAPVGRSSTLGRSALSRSALFLRSRVQEAPVGRERPMLTRERHDDLTKVAEAKERTS